MRFRTILKIMYQNIKSTCLMFKDASAKPNLNTEVAKAGWVVAGRTCPQIESWKHTITQLVNELEFVKSGPAGS